jgi:hypothetical protein
MTYCFALDRFLLRNPLYLNNDACVDRDPSTNGDVREASGSKNRKELKTVVAQCLHRVAVASAFWFLAAGREALGPTFYVVRQGHKSGSHLPLPVDRKRSRVPG